MPTRRTFIVREEQTESFCLRLQFSPDFSALKDEAATGQVNSEEHSRDGSGAPFQRSQIL